MRLVLDLTSMARWLGPPVGLVRVQRHYAAAAAAFTASEVVFTLFDPVDRVLRQVSPQIAAEIIAGDISCDMSFHPDPARIQMRFHDRWPNWARQSLMAVIRARRILTTEIGALSRRNSRQHFPSFPRTDRKPADEGKRAAADRPRRRLTRPNRAAADRGRQPVPTGARRPSAHGLRGMGFMGFDGSPGRAPDLDPLPQSRLRRKLGDGGCPLLDGQYHWDYLSSTACGAEITQGEKYHDLARRRPERRNRPDAR
jgi:hypothetical protein